MGQILLMLQNFKKLNNDKAAFKTSQNPIANFAWNLTFLSHTGTFAICNISYPEFLPSLILSIYYSNYNHSKQLATTTALTAFLIISGGHLSG
jgi:hypothetical protein